MTDLEKVVKGLRQHCEGSMFDRCGECPYYEIDHEPFICRDMLLNDLNAMLKEQDADTSKYQYNMRPLVLCENCKYRSKEMYVYYRFPYNKVYVCQIHDLAVKPNWFCADGERKEGR